MTSTSLLSRIQGPRRGCRNTKTTDIAGHISLAVTEAWGEGVEETVSRHTKGTNLLGLCKNLNHSCKPGSEEPRAHLEPFGKNALVPAHFTVVGMGS